MSLRNSPELTSQLVDAARSNARRSHGPRSAAGKQNCRMNALQHGERSDPENHYDVMRALGEDPAQFEALQQELRDAFRPGDALSQRQVDDLARLYWRRQRLERMETGLMRRALLALEERQHRRRLEIEGATIQPGQAINIGLTEPSDPAARLRLRRSFLALIREQVRERSFLPWQGEALQGFYQRASGWRPARLCALLQEFAEKARQLAEEKARRERLDQDAAAWLASAAGGEVEGSGGEAAAAQEIGPGDGEPVPGGPGVPLEAPAAAPPCADPLEELRYRELLALLEVEIAQAKREFEYEEALHEKRVAIERDACLAPEGEQWKLMLRREETLDRSIDRKIKLLLTLRKAAAQAEKLPHESAALSPGERVSRSGALIIRSVTGEGSLPREEQPAARPHPDKKPGEAAAARRDAKIDERSGNVVENKGQLTSAAGQQQAAAPVGQGMSDAKA